MLEQDGQGLGEEKKLPSSGMLLSVEPLRGPEQYHAERAENGDTDTDTQDTSGDRVDGDGTDKSDADTTDAVDADADGTDVVDTDTDGTDSDETDADGTDASTDRDSVDN
jgi:hypothetical protein